MIIVSGITVMVVVLVILLYNRVRLKQRSNALVAEINKQNELLKTLMEEKAWLLREVHHRVKNNLQIVISLLNSQSAYLDNEAAIAAIRNSQHRMYAMSLIHLRLYKADNLSSIDMAWYIDELVDYTRQSFVTAKRIDFVLDTDAIALDIVQAIPAGLILNEAISNAVKYAFADRDKGIVTISLKRLRDDVCQITVADNGVGLPEGFNAAARDSLGLNLMRGLTDQLDGTLTLETKDGLTVRVTFRIHARLYASELQALQGG